MTKYNPKLSNCLNKAQTDCMFLPCMSRTHFRVNLLSIVAGMSRNSLLETGAIFEVQVTTTGFERTAT